MEYKKLKKFYKNKKVLVTGNTGFKGIWLFLILKFLGAKVKGYSLPLIRNDNFIFFKILKKYLNKDTVYGNILDFRKLSKTVRFFSCYLKYSIKISVKDETFDYHQLGYFK